MTTSQFSYPTFFLKKELIFLFLVTMKTRFSPREPAWRPTFWKCASLGYCRASNNVGIHSRPRSGHRHVISLLPTSASDGSRADTCSTEGRERGQGRWGAHPCWRRRARWGRRIYRSMKCGRRWRRWVIPRRPGKDDLWTWVARRRAQPPLWHRPTWGGRRQGAHGRGVDLNHDDIARYLPSSSPSSPT
jgi:hypothetical protein